MLAIAIFLMLKLALPAPADEVYTGLRHETLFSRLGLEVERDSVGMAGVRDAPCVFYIFLSESGGADGMLIGVYPTVAAAEVVFEGLGVRPIMRTHPLPLPPGPDIGDKMRWHFWLDGPKSPGASVEFRRRNIFISFTKVADPESVVAIARQIDHMIQTDREIAPLGTFDPTPEIVDIGIPAQLNVRPMRRVYNLTDSRGTRELLEHPEGGDQPLCFVRIEPQFRGLGNVEKLRLMVLRGDASYGSLLQDDRSPVGRDLSKHQFFDPTAPDRVRFLPGSQAVAEGYDGRFVLRVEVPDGPKTQKYRMIAASEDNVIVTKEVEVTITPQ